MKNLMLITLFCLCSKIGLGQCPNSPIELFTQADIDNFAVNYPGCSQITNGLSIFGGSDFSGLSQITSVESILRVQSTSNFDFTGLGNVTSIDHLWVENTSIVNFNGFDSLLNLEVFYVLFNNSLINFDGLQGVTSISSFRVENNQNLMSFNGLNNLEEIADPNGVFVWIFNNPSIVNMTGLEALTRIEGTLRFSNNDSLESLSGLENLEWIDGSLWIVEHDVLFNISSISNIDNLTGTFLNFVIQNNPLLSECSIGYVCQYINDPNANYTISNNLVGCNSKVEIEQNCILGTEDSNYREKVILFPNPTNNILNIKSQNKIDTARIYTSQGRFIAKIIDNTANVSNLESGIYFINISTNGENIVKKLIKN